MLSRKRVKSHTLSVSKNEKKKHAYTTRKALTSKETNRHQIKQLTIMGVSSQNISKQNEPGGLYPFGKRPVNSQL